MVQRKAEVGQRVIVGGENPGKHAFQPGQIRLLHERVVQHVHVVVPVQHLKAPRPGVHGNSEEAEHEGGKNKPAIHSADTTWSSTKSSSTVVQGQSSSR